MNGIDFVVTWVGDLSKEWIAEKSTYVPQQGTDDRPERYRDFGLLPYFLRSIEAYAPWVRKIHLVITGEVPSYVNTDHEKLSVVRHEDYIPKEFLPCYNSNVLELYLHRIPDLAEHFVYFNDDMFLLQKTEPGDFFRDGKPCDMLCFQPVIANPENPVMSYIYLNNMQVLARHFQKRQQVKAHPGHYFKVGYPLMYFGYNLLEMAFPQYTGLYTVHGPSPFCRQTFVELWEKEGELLTSLSAMRFRSERDVSQYLFREWQKLSGNMQPVNLLKDFAYFELSEDNEKLVQTITGGRKKCICMNDTAKYTDAQKVKNTLIQAMEKRLPQKSAFEKQTVSRKRGAKE